MSEILTVEQLEKKTLKEIYAYAKELKIPCYSQMNKKELSLAVIRAQEEKQGFFMAEGVLDIMAQQDFGFLRPINYTSSKEDIYISASQIKRFGLRNGDKVTGKARPPKPSERYYGLMQVSKVNGSNPEQAKERSHFPALTPLYPDRRIKLETEQSKISARMIDIVAPVGFGQRGLIVAPPKAGKTTLLKAIANGIAENYPEAELIVLLIDERPEEVTDIERSVKGEVVSSTFDQQPQNHVRVAELVLERAMRLVEDKQDVIILMDSITRLARAYNLVIPASGRTLSGGINPAALYRPKKFFGAARNIEEGGSLTILATALVETGSRMDDIIYEEFKGTGNSELHLSRELSERRIFPAIDVKKSSTRKEELLLDKEYLDEIWKLRHAMVTDSLELTNQFIQALRNSENNKQFFESFSEKTFSQVKNTRNIRR
ncbi:transcription termination factor Rho [Carnobacterium iners]|uniref:Transcription termination factor Rho n=1 Tax=Carnobacterium iners TaxID=1073423 RepID=A0A1X7MQN0_9LACT|nr:transcription termination factor Rho [Carnobacterium iners]SEL12158.1 transcription termination factor Rho [Carnobacterium iners]SMH27122.1 transcription termination factor Rho [Carnobacterium iners]